MKFVDSAVGKAHRSAGNRIIIFREEIIKDWTPIFEVFEVVEVQRSSVLNYDDKQKIQCPLRPATDKTAHIGKDCTVDEIVNDVSIAKVRENYPYLLCSSKSNKQWIN